MIELHADGQVYVVTGRRAEQIIRWLLVNEQRVAQADRLQVVFHCVSDRMTRVEVRIFDELDKSVES